MKGGAPPHLPVSRRIRRTARVILLGPDGHILLFRFAPPGTAPFWIMPGGECDPQEDYPQAAQRELLEETGIFAAPLPLQVIREAEYEYFGEPVKSVEHFLYHRTDATRIDTSGHTQLEQSVMREHRWFTPAELLDWPETVYPLDIAELVQLTLQLSAQAGSA